MSEEWRTGLLGMMKDQEGREGARKNVSQKK